MPELYVVIMRRWGDPEAHSYLLGVFDDPEKATKAGTDEMTRRGNKYDMDMWRIRLNEVKKRVKIDV